MPSVRGLLGIICLLFAPYVELRVDERRTCVTGALCGIGCDDNGVSYDQENDIEVAFDTKFVIGDIEKINCIRFWINRILGSIDGEETLNRETSAQAQLKIVEYLSTLFSEQRENLLPAAYRDAYEWNQIPKEHLMISSADSKQFIYPLICGVELCETKMEDKIYEIDKQLAAMKMIIEGHEMNNPMTCGLCEIYVDTSRSLKMHLTSTCHKSRLRNYLAHKKQFSKQKSH